MSFVKDVVKVAISPLAAVLGAVKKKPKAAPVPTPTVTRNDAADRAARNDVLARRRGAAANQLLGARGAESTQGKTSLGS